MSFQVANYAPQPSAAALKSATAALMRAANPNVQVPSQQVGGFPAKVPYEQGANGLYVPSNPGQEALQQINAEMRARLAGLDQAMAQIAMQLSPVARQNLTPELLAQAALGYQNFGFRAGLDNPTAPPIDGENGEIEGPVVLKTIPSAAASIGTVPTALSIDAPLDNNDQTITGGGRLITAIGLALMPSGAAANLPSGYDAKSLKQALIDIGLVQVLIGTTIKAQYDAKDLIDTQFVQRILEQPIRVQRGNYQAISFRFVTVTPPPAAAASTYSLMPVFTTYWPPVR